MKTINGWAYPDADEFMWREQQADGSYQGSHLARALEIVRDFRLAIDGGAHVGTWSRIMSGAFDRVIAVEPSPDTFECLQANLEAFGCRNVEARQIAIGAVAGSVSMVLEGRAAAMQNTGGRQVVAGGTIPLERIDDWHLEALGFLKLDIEGSEPLALEGARETLLRCRPIVLFEHKGLCRRYNRPPDACQTFLTGIGYVELATVSMDRVWGPR